MPYSDRGQRSDEFKLGEGNEAGRTPVSVGRSTLPLRADRLYHLAVRDDGPVEYRPASLDHEGFVHLSTHCQLASTVKRHFSSGSVLRLLELDPSRLSGELRWETAPGRADPMPHLYDALNPGALTCVFEVLL